MKLTLNQQHVVESLFVNYINEKEQVLKCWYHQQVVVKHTIDIWRENQEIRVEKITK